MRRLLDWSPPPSIWVVENEPLRDARPDGERIRRVQPGRNRGYAGGVNDALRAMESTDYEFALLINTDLDLAEETVRTLQLTLLQEPGIGFVGPLLEEPGPDGLRVSAGGRDPARWISSRKPFAGEPGRPLLREVDYVPGTVCLFRRAVVEKVGFLDERFFFSGEVAEYCWRGRQAGFRSAIHTGVRVRHEVEPASPVRSTVYLYYSLRNRFLIARVSRPRDWPAWWVYWTLVGLAMMAQRWLRGLRPSARAAGLALRDAWTGRFGETRHVFTP